MLAKVEIESKEGVTLMRYKNARFPAYSDSQAFLVSERQNGLVFRGFYTDAEDKYIAKDALKSLVRDLAIEKDSFILKKHAMVYCYIDNYLTAKSPAFSIPRKRRDAKPLQISMADKKKVFVEVADKILQRSSQGRSCTTSYGQIVARPTDDVGSMSLKIDSRSMGGITNMQFSPLVSVKREGAITLLTSPSREAALISYTFQCSEKDLPAVKAVLIDSKTVEILLCFDADLAPESFRAALSFDFPVGGVSVECKKGRYEYTPGDRTLVWTVSPTESLSLTVRTTEPHRSSTTLKYGYHFSKKAVSSVVVNSLSSEADENWIRYTTSVSGLLRASE